MEPPREEKSLEGVGSLSTVALEGKLGSSIVRSRQERYSALVSPACFVAWPDSIAFPAAVFATRLRLRIRNVHRSIDARVPSWPHGTVLSLRA